MIDALLWFGARPWILGFGALSLFWLLSVAWFLIAAGRALCYPDRTR